MGMLSEFCVHSYDTQSTHHTYYRTVATRLQFVVTQKVMRIYVTSYSKK